MATRRDVLRLAGMAAAGLLVGSPSGTRVLAGLGYSSRRPPVEKRRFVSEAVEAKIAEVRRTITDPELDWLFENCYPNTLDTTVTFRAVGGKPDTFVITGDIPAMWLRDSSAQVWPYVPLAADDTRLRSLLAGVIRRQTRCILIDPYANAFNEGPSGSPWASDLTAMKPELHERKWEIDSLCYPLRLAHGYWRATGDASPFDAEWRQAMRLVVDTLRVQQRKEGNGPYHFQRTTNVWYDTLPLNGYGNPTRRVGLIHSGFRPSDDACIYPFLIPSNLFAVVSLRQMAELLEHTGGEAATARAARDLAGEVEALVQQYGVTRNAAGENMYVYEVDGFGNRLFMDDANVPSLLALPYLGVCGVDDACYRATRAQVLSEANPYFFTGSAGEGIGGPHVGPDMIWPLSIIMRGLTSVEEKEMLQCLRLLRDTHAGTGFMHESFHRNDPARYTRAWFAWANTLLGEFIVRIHAEHPALLARV